MVADRASLLAEPKRADLGDEHLDVAGLATALGEDGHEVVVYARRDKRGMAERVPLGTGTTLVPVRAGPARALRPDEVLPHVATTGNALRELWRADPPDIVHSHSWTAAVAALVGRPEQTPVVHTFHTLVPPSRHDPADGDHAPPERIRLERAVGHDVDHIIATSTYQVRELAAIGIRRTDATVIPGGVDLAEFHPNGPALDRGNRPRLLCMGKLTGTSGVDTVIAGLRGAPDAELLVVGEPHTGRQSTDDPEAKKLAELARRVGVADRVHLMDPVPRDDVPALIRSADLMVCTPTDGDVGSAPLAAMACGRALLATPVGRLADLVVENATGVLVRPGQPRVIARALRDLLENPVLLEGFGVAAHERAEVRYSWARLAQETADVYAVLSGQEAPEQRHGTEDVMVEEEKAEEEDKEVAYG